MQSVIISEDLVDGLIEGWRVGFHSRKRKNESKTQTAEAGS